MKYDDVKCPKCGATDWEDESYVDWDSPDTVMLYGICEECGSHFTITAELDVIEVKLVENAVPRSRI